MVKSLKLKLSFAQWLLVWLVTINLFGCVAVLVNTAVTENRSIKENHMMRMQGVLDFLQNSMASSVSSFSPEERRQILQVISPVIHAHPEMDVWGVVETDGKWGLKTWTRAGGDGSLKEFLPLDVAQALIDSDSQEMEYQNFFLATRPVYRTDESTGDKELFAHLIAGNDLSQSTAELFPHLIELAGQLILVVLAQLLVVSVFLDRNLRKPLRRISDRAADVGQEHTDVSAELSNMGDLERIEKAVELLGSSRAEYRQQEAHLRAILATIKEAVLVLDEDLHIVEVNQEFVTTWGYTPDEIIGQPAQRILHQQHWESTQRDIDKYKETGVATSSDTLLHLTAVDSNGKEFPIDYIFSECFVGRQRMFVVTVSDMSEQERQKAELIEAKETAEKAQKLAEQAAAAKAVFLANMSHEIRTPMNGVMGLLDLVGDTGLNSQQAAMIKTAKVSAESLLNVLNDILDISKIEAGKIDLERTEYELGTLIEDVVTLFHVAAVDKGLELSCYVDPLVDKHVIGDPTRLRQIASNIIGNAVKFTSEGEVEVRLEVNSAPVGRYALSLLVRDTGIGMSKEAMDSLFDPFSQADSSTTRKFGGTGLGMAISRQLVELMDGAISVESELGVGTTFRVNIELPTSARKGATYKDRACLPKTTVLVVDDNATNREIMAAYLSSWGIEYELAKSASAAWKILTQVRQAPFDICLMDYHMPDADGVDLARKITESKVAPNMALALLSSGSADTKKIEEVGISTSLSKPIRQAELFDLIARSRDVEVEPEEEEQSNEKEMFEGRVLLVEDNKVNQLVAQSLLEKMGMTVDLVMDGEKSLEAMSARDYDLVLMDCLMPIMDGYEATAKRRELESEKSLERMPIVALTANAMSGDREQCLNAGMDDFLSKPINLDELTEKLRFWISRKGSGEEKQNSLMSAR